MVIATRTRQFITGSAAALLLLAGAAVFLAPSTAAVAQPAAEASAAKVHKIDLTHSVILFRVMHLNTAWNYGTFNDFSGTITVDPADATKSSVSIEIKADSIDTRNEKRDQHLKSPDFFSAAEFPTITFQSTSVKSLGGDKFEVVGDLTLLGQSKPVTATFTKTGEGKNRQGASIVGYEANFSFKRSDYGMTYMQQGLGDEIQVTVSVEAVAE